MTLLYNLNEILKIRKYFHESLDHLNFLVYYEIYL